MVLKYILDIVSADVNAIPDFTAYRKCLSAVTKRYLEDMVKVRLNVSM
nr:MAG TPA: hypothetical protein [Caudoviricetes sp.]